MTELLNMLKTTILDNQLATGGLVVVFTSSIMYVLRSLPHVIYGRLKRLVLIEVEIRQPDILYNWLSLWLSATNCASRARMLTASANTLLDEHNGDDTRDPRRLGITLTPGLGHHFVRIAPRHWALVQRSRQEKDSANQASRGGMMSFMERESYEITVLRWSRPALVKFLDEVRLARAQEEAAGPDIYIAQKWGEWAFVQKSLPRQLDSVHLPDNIGERVVERCRRFLESRDQYIRRGSPWRLGILLHGDPGNGKSSLISAMASELNMDIGYINLADDEMSDSGLLEAMGRSGRRIIVLEDIDALYHGREKKESAKGISFSGLLNSIDGIVSSEGRILVMTTNHVDKLDPALIRPGRVDINLAIPYPREEQLRAVYRKFRPTTDGMDDFVARHLGSSMATAQQELEAQL